jgi:hypothetical protein
MQSIKHPHGDFHREVDDVGSVEPEGHGRLDGPRKEKYCEHSLSKTVTCADGLGWTAMDAPQIRCADDVMGRPRACSPK